MSSEPPFDAVGIAQRQFRTARKGYDPSDVRAFLHEIADLIGAAHRREAFERERAERAEGRAELAENLDRHRLVELLGEETVRVLDAARDAASDIRTKAEESVARMLVDAQEKSRAITEKTESASEARKVEILAEVESLRSEAQDELELRRAEGQELVDEMRVAAEQVLRDAEDDAGAIRELARQDGRALVAEAELARERILGDLARRRRTAREQIERLNAARERLLDAYDVVRLTVDEATTELTVALPEAKAAGDLAMRRVQAEPTPTAQDLEAELAVGPMTGLVADTPTQTVGDPSATGDPGPPAEAVTDQTVTVLGEVPSRMRAIGFLGEISMPRPSTARTQSDAHTRAVGKSWGLWPSRRSDILNLDSEPDTTDEVSVDGGTSGADETDGEDGTQVGDANDAAPVTDTVDEAETDGEQPVGRVDALFARIRAVHNTGPPQSEEPAPSVTDEPPEADTPADVAQDAASRLLARDVVLAGPELELSRRLKRVLADDQNEVFDRLRRVAPGSATDVLPPVAEQADRYARAGLDELDAAARAGAESVGGVLRTSCRALATEMGEALVEPLRERTVCSFDECGDDLDEVTNRLRALYREWKGQRISEVVRHYTTAAFAWGAYEASPRGTDLIWLVDRTGEPCPDADDNALAGPVRKGQPFPTGDRCAPAHPGCRCLVVPAG